MLRRSGAACIALLLALWAHAAYAVTSEPVAFDPAAAVKASQGVIGNTVGEHALSDRTGRRVMLSSYRGKPVVSNYSSDTSR
jgi:hypothetical protein